MKKAVSIIIPYYNRADYFARTLQSIVQQTYRPLEILLVDNVSTDSSVEIAKKFREQYQEEDFNVRLLTCDKRGAAAARNKGLYEAHGDYTYFFDSDDEMSDTFISEAIATAESGHFDVVFAVTKMIMADGRQIVRKYVYSKNLHDQILTGMLSTQTMFFRTDFVKHIGGWAENLLYWNDWELGIRVLSACPKTVWLKKHIYHSIFQHAESITGLSFSDSFLKIMDAFRQAEIDISKAPLKEKKGSFKALRMRENIIAAHLFREGHPEQSRKCLQQAENISVSISIRFLAHFLYLFTRLGGRGGWRIAHFFC